MAEIVGIIGSAIAIANSAATLSRALFDIVESIHNARREITDIAHQLQLLSGTLHLLWDFVHSQNKLCRPGLFHNINAILEQYVQVDKELRELVKTPKTLARLTWHFRRTKVKSQLKRVEAVKTSLCLALNVVQLAREEAIRPPTEDSSAVQAKPLPNRFRKLVESAVQANRQVVESAQRQAAKDTHASSAQQRAEINVYKEGSFDTATWLYHLVFETHSPDISDQSDTQSSRPFQASVVDEVNEHVVRFARSPAERDSATWAQDLDKTMIVWGRQTETGRVVDRLLSEWTTLTDEQIGLSSTRQQDEDWWESFKKVVEEAKDEDDWDTEKWDEDFDSDEAERSAEETSARFSVQPPFAPSEDDSKPKRRSVSSDYGSVTSIDVPSIKRPPQDDTSLFPEEGPSAKTARRERKKDKSKRSKVQNIYRAPPPAPMPRRRAGEDSAASESFPRWNPKPPPEPSRHSDSRPYVQGAVPEYSKNPFRPIQPTFQNPVQPHWHGYPPPTASFPQNPPWPFPEANEPLRTETIYPKASAVPDPVLVETTSSQERTKQDEMLAAIKSIIERAQKQQEGRASEPQFDRIVQLLVTQQEQQVQSEIERARVTAEVEMKQVLAARDKDHAKIQRLEKLIVQQRDEQQAANARWQAERALLDQEAAQQMRQAQELAERQIAAARSAKKAERKTLKFAKAEAEKREKEAANAKAKEERKKIDKKSKERIQKYESLLDRAVDMQSQAVTASEQPFRRICIINGNQRMEVEEYNEDMRGTPNVLTSRFLEQAAQGIGAPGIYNNGLPKTNQRRISQSGTPRGTLVSSRMSEVVSNTAGSSNEDRQVILFPPHLDQNSSKINELQSSLSDAGLDVQFADMEKEGHSDWSLREQGTDIVRSSVFWEAPVLGSGSELLTTLRSFGWQPPYARSSDAGQTFFLGSQPIHSYFFRPNYRPQFSPCKASDFLESIIIDQALIQEYALLEFGFQFEVTKHGSYVLDGRLQYSDIEALIERSFAMRETYHRRAYRQLIPPPPIKQHVHQSAPSLYEEPQSPSSTIESDVCETVSDSEVDNDGQLERRSSYASSSADTCLGLERAGRSSNASLKTASDSRTSWSSQSNNPFRKNSNAISRSKTGSQRSDSDAGSMINFPNDNHTIWDGALIDLS